MNKTDDREKSFLLLTAALVISLVFHGVLLVLLSSCSITTFTDDLKANRRATKDMPEMQVTRFERDPISAFDDAQGRPAAAPVEENLAQRVDRLGEGADERAAEAAFGMPNETALTPIAPALEAPGNFAPSVQVAPVPQAPNDDAMPAKVFGSVRATPVLGTPEIAPAPTLLTRSTAAPQLGFAPSSLSLPTAPQASLVPSGSLMTTAGAPRFSLGSPLGGEGAGREIQKRPPPPPAPADVMKQVDEKVVAREKEAVRGLRDDTGDAKLPDFASHVRLTLYVRDNGNGTRNFRVRMVSNLADPLPPLDKDVIFLMDVSGSIGPDRLKSCSRAVQQVIRELNSEDRFEIVAFRDKFSHCFSGWRAVDEPAIAAAEEFLGHQMVRGNTDVFGMIRQVLTMPRDPTRPVIALFVTDAEATTGLTQTQDILTAFSKLNGGLISIYMYGVKDAANVPLMRAVSEGARGAHYRHEGHRRDCARRFAGFNARFAEPLLTDIVVAYAAASQVFDPAPRFPRNLYTGDAVEFRGTCPKSVRELVFSVRGLAGNQPMEGFFKLDFAKAVRE